MGGAWVINNDGFSVDPLDNKGVGQESTVGEDEQYDGSMRR